MDRSSSAGEGAFRHGAARYPVRPERIPPGALDAGRYRVRYARGGADLEAVQRLRYQVFNLELGEGLDTAYATGLDADRHDGVCHHLMVLDRERDAVIGTYRLTSRELLGSTGWYSAGEFALAEVPGEVLEGAVEVGRACVHADHRNGQVLQLLWKGIARYLDFNRKRYLFGCCSVPSLQPEYIAQITAQLAREGALHASIRVDARSSEHFAHMGPVELQDAAELPPLFASYLRLGARVCSGPAADEEFGVTDYLVLLDLLDVPAAVLARLGRASAWRGAA